MLTATNTGLLPCLPALASGHGGESLDSVLATATALNYNTFAPMPWP